jgi:hypothetical protein
LSSRIIIDGPSIFLAAPGHQILRASPDRNSIYSALRSHSYFSLLSTLEDNPASNSLSSAEDFPEDFEDDDDDDVCFSL